MVLKTIIFTVLFAVLSRYVFYFLVKRGVGVHYNSHHPGHCRVVPGIDCGSEQVRVTKDGLAFITNGHRETNKCNVNFIRGHMYLFDFNHPENNVTQLKIEVSEIDPPPLNLDAFDPHGMDILDDGENIKLFVVNHANSKESIEVFLFDSNNRRLKHLETITDEKFQCLNDLTAVSEKEFYVTNWKKTCYYPSIFSIIEILGAFNTANIVHYKDGKSTIVAHGTGFNGIAQSKDGKEVVVASYSTTYVHVFDRQSGGGLRSKTKVNVGHFPDNINVDATTGDYYIGVMKHIFQFGSRAKNSTKVLSSAAIKVTANDDWKKVDVREILHDEGRDFISGVSVAAHYKGQYLFGTVYDRLAHCVKY